MKSHASDLIELATHIYRDIAATTATVPDQRDLDTLRLRVEKEGISFLTLTLPTLAGDLERSLSDGFISSTRFRSFKKRGKVPAFLQGYFMNVFDVGTGRIIDEPCKDSVRSIRQFSSAFKKIRIACAPHREAKAITQFISCEQDLEEELHTDYVNDFTKVANCLWGKVFADSNIIVQDLIPRHGPGATAEKISGNRKFKFLRWHDRLEPYFPLLSNAYPNEGACESEEFEKVSVITEEQEQPVRVITVPKTLKGPRIIAIEPVCMQYTQQAISKALVKALEGHFLTGGHVNFTDQSINQRLAISSSRDRRYSTIDLSSASDRVPLDLASYMFNTVPDLKGAVLACRSRRASHPQFNIIKLRKFASMGSALCFPIEAMYFYTICVMALLEKRGLPVSVPSIASVKEDIYVYGDDILVPTNEVASVIEYLQKYHCKVNTAKSFWDGKFRESCGMDAYDGVDVSITYIRELRPSDRKSTKALISWVSTSNQFYSKGYLETASHMIKVCENILGKLPIVGERCSGLGKVWPSSLENPRVPTRWNERLHRLEVKTWVAKPVRIDDALSGQAALLKCLVKMELKPPPLPRNLSLKQFALSMRDLIVEDSDHLEQTVKRGTVNLRRRWICPQ